MLEGSNSHEPLRRDEGSNLWRAMQSAYEDYRRASEALESIHRSADNLSTSERLRLTVVEGQQRVTFERYLEARIEYLEFRFDERNRLGADPAVLPIRDTECSGIGSWLTFANCRRLLPMFAVMLLCTAAFFWVRPQKHERDPGTFRTELRATPNPSHDGLPLLGQKPDTGGPPLHSAIKEVAHTTVAPAGPSPAITPPAGALKPPGKERERQQPAGHVQPKQPAPKWARVSQTGGQSTGARADFNFSLVPSRQFKRIGPIEVSLQSVDARQHCASLSIVSGPVKMDVQRLPLDQPVWINVGHQQLLGLVVDRIVGNRLDGHLTKSRDDKPELRTSRLKSGMLNQATILRR